MRKKVIMIEHIIPGDKVEKDKEDFVIVDVRSKDEYEQGHIEGAINIAYDEINENIDKLDKKEPTIVYCASNNRANIARLSLKSNGFDFVYVGEGLNYYDYNLVK